jgi:hypothetical protein
MPGRGEKQLHFSSNPEPCYKTLNFFSQNIVVEFKTICFCPNRCISEKLCVT